MKPVVAILAPGSMGSAVGARLVAHGVTVTTPLAGRSAASAERARAAGMTPVDDAKIATADFVLSIVPPGDALSVSERFAPMFAASNEKPVYVECNAVNPATVARIEAVVGPTGAPFVDAGIIGPPPQPNTTNTIFYASGADAPRLASLAEYGLNVRLMDGPVGAASALKMSYAGITKGFTALGAAMMLAAMRQGTADALYAELAVSQPALHGWLTRNMPRMYPRPIAGSPRWRRSRASSARTRPRIRSSRARPACMSGSRRISPPTRPRSKRSTPSSPSAPRRPNAPPRAAPASRLPAPAWAPPA